MDFFEVTSVRCVFHEARHDDALDDTLGPAHYVTNKRGGKVCGAPQVSTEKQQAGSACVAFPINYRRAHALRRQEREREREREIDRKKERERESRRGLFVSLDNIYRRWPPHSTVSAS